VNESGNGKLNGNQMKKDRILLCPYYSCVASVSDDGDGIEEVVPSVSQFLLPSVLLSSLSFKKRT